MLISLEHLPILQDDFTVDRVDAPNVAEISLVSYKFHYLNRKDSILHKAVQIFGTDEKRETLYGCHTIEEEDGRKIFNILGGDEFQCRLLMIPTRDILKYQILR